MTEHKTVYTNERVLRYTAFDNPGTMVLTHAEPPYIGGQELAVYSTNTVYKSVCSFQGCTFHAEVFRKEGGGWRRILCERFPTFAQAYAAIEDGLKKNGFLEAANA